MLPIDQITVDHTLNVRAAIDEETVERYAAVFDRLPPVIVYHLPGDGVYLLVDGFHRVEAARRLEFAEVPVEVREGTRDDAEEYALTANVGHGRTLTRAERRRAIARMVRLHPERSDAWIARDMGVSSNTVRLVREELEATSQIARFDRLVGADGKERPRELEQAREIEQGGGKEEAASCTPDLSLARPSTEDTQSPVSTREVYQPAGACPPSSVSGRPSRENRPTGVAYRVVCGRIEDWASHYEGEKFHALLADPPYHLPGAFMGQGWDKGGVAFCSDIWAMLAEHMLPGAFGMVFASARGWHRIAVAIEDAGLILHHNLFLWVQGQGMTKATSIHAQLERQLCEKRGDSWFYRDTGEPMADQPPFRIPMANVFYGHRYGQQVLAPRAEPVVLFQAPYEDHLDSILTTGAGALNVDAARLGWLSGKPPEIGMSEQGDPRERSRSNPRGRWPTNFVLVHHELCRPVLDESGETSRDYTGSDDLEPVARYACARCCPTCGYQWLAEDREPCPECGGESEWQCPVRQLDEQAGITSTTGNRSKHSREAKVEGTRWLVADHKSTEYPGNRGGASRYFSNCGWSYEIAERLATSAPVRYCPKPGRREKDAGLEGPTYAKTEAWESSTPLADRMHGKTRYRNNHPCIKPIDLTRWLSALLLPPPEFSPRRLLVPFAGSDTEMIGAGLAGWDDVIGVEQSADAHIGN